MAPVAKGAKQAACAPPPTDLNLCAFCTQPLYVGGEGQELREDAGACVRPACVGALSAASRRSGNHLFQRAGLRGHEEEVPRRVHKAVLLQDGRTSVRAACVGEGA